MDEAQIREQLEIEIKAKLEATLRSEISKELSTKFSREIEEWKEIQASLMEAHQSRVPDGIPVILITAMGPRVLPKFVTEKQRTELNAFRPMWLKFHQQWIDKLPNGRHLITENSGHGIPFEEPELVVNTIRQIIDLTRTPEL